MNAMNAQMKNWGQDSDEEFFGPNSRKPYALFELEELGDEFVFPEDWNEQVKEILSMYMEKHKNFGFTTSEEVATRWHGEGRKVFAVGIYTYPSRVTAACCKPFDPSCSGNYWLYMTTRWRLVGG